MQGWKAGTKGDWKSDGVADAKKTPVSFVGEREGGGGNGGERLLTTFLL